MLCAVLLCGVPAVLPGSAGDARGEPTAASRRPRLLCGRGLRQGRHGRWHVRLRPADPLPVLTVST